MISYAQRKTGDTVNTGATKTAYKFKNTHIIYMYTYENNVQSMPSKLTLHPVCNLQLGTGGPAARYCVQTDSSNQLHSV